MSGELRGKIEPTPEIRVVLQGSGPQGKTGEKGESGLLAVTQTADTTLTLAANSCTVVTGQPTALNITLGAPVSDTDTEWRLIFKAGEGFQLTDTAPSGYAIQWDCVHK